MKQGKVQGRGEVPAASHREGREYRALPVSPGDTGANKSGAWKDLKLPWEWHLYSYYQWENFVDSLLAPGNIIGLADIVLSKFPV